jgi:hypothetical protein
MASHLRADAESRDWNCLPLLRKVKPSILPNTVVHDIDLDKEEMALQEVDHVAISLDAPNADPLKDTKYDCSRDLIGYGRDSFDPKWPSDAKIAVSFVINYEEVRSPFTV